MPVIIPVPDRRPFHNVELYEFVNNVEQMYFTPHEFDVDVNGHLYNSVALERSNMTLGAEAAKSALELKVPSDSMLVKRLLEAALIGETTSVTLLAVKIDQQNCVWDSIGARWVGRVVGVDIAADAARIHCESAQVSMKRIGLRRLYSRKCSHVLYSAACGATPVTGSAIVSAVDGRNVDLDGGVPSSVSSNMAGGWLQTPNGMRYMVTSEYGMGVELLYPAPIEPGTLVSLTVGCDRGINTCYNVFNNVINYGGFPYIPDKNPFSTGVF